MKTTINMQLTFNSGLIKVESEEVIRAEAEKLLATVMPIETVELSFFNLAPNNDGVGLASVVEQLQFVMVDTDVLLCIGFKMGGNWYKPEVVWGKYDDAVLPVYSSRELTDDEKETAGKKTKKCSWCQTEKTLNHFTKYNRNKDGLSGWCRSCGKERVAASKANVAKRKIA